MRLCLLLLLSVSASAEMLVKGHAETLRALHRVWRASRSLSAARRNEELEKADFVKLLTQDLPSRARRSIASQVVESAKCEHIDLVDCSEYRTQEMSCMLTATGMTCCVCLGRLEYIKGAWKMLRPDDSPRRRIHKSRRKNE